MPWAGKLQITLCKRKKPTNGVESLHSKAVVDLRVSSVSSCWQGPSNAGPPPKNQGPYQRKREGRKEKEKLHKRLGQRAPVAQWHNRQGWQRTFFFFFFFFLLLTFWNHWNLLLIFQNGNFYWEKGISCQEKNITERPTVSCWQDPFP